MTSLLHIHRAGFLDAIRSVNPPNKWKVVVVDPYCERLINKVIPLYDIIEENVTSVDNIEKQRDRNPSFEALYIVHPNRYNIETIIQDFIDPQNKRYAAAHIRFISSVDNRTIAKISNSPIRPIIRSLVDLNLDFNPIESMVFSTRTPESFQVFYNASCRVLVDSELVLISKKLVSVCASLGENPIIRFYRPTENSHPARSHASRLAQLLQAELDEYAAGNPDFPPRSNSRPRAVLLLCERGFDVVTPLLHEFTYQAMANDLLPIEDGTTYKYEFRGATGAEEKKAVLDDKDTLWTSIRHMHMKDTIDKLMLDFNKFCQENTNFTDKDKATSLNDMRDMLATLPQFQEMRDQFSLHLNMAEKCMELFEEKKLLNIGLVEQSCATGATPEGKIPKTVLEEIVPLLRHPELSAIDKMRILMLYVLFKDGILEEDLQLLLRHAGLDSRAYELPLRNLDLLGPIRITKSFAEHKAANKSRKRPKPSNSEEDSYELSRFVPPIKQVLEDVVNGTLDPQTWAYTVDQPPESQITGQQGSLRSQRPTWASRGAAKGTEQRQRIIVFIAGGATYSESRSCYEVSKKWNRDVVLGSTDMITPSTFIRELSRTRESRQSLNLAMDQMRSIPQQTSQQAPPQQQYQTQAPPGAQSGLPSRPSAGRMGPPPNIPSQMRPGSGHGSRNGLSGPRPMGGGGPRSPPAHVAHGPGHAVTPVNSYGSQHRPTSSGGSKDGDKKDKEKKKKKLGLF